MLPQANADGAPPHPKLAARGCGNSSAGQSGGSGERGGDTGLALNRYGAGALCAVDSWLQWLCQPDGAGMPASQLPSEAGVVRLVAHGRGGARLQNGLGQEPPGAQHGIRPLDGNTGKPNLAIDPLPLPAAGVVVRVS